MHGLIRILAGAFALALLAGAASAQSTAPAPAQQIGLAPSPVPPLQPPAMGSGVIGNPSPDMIKKIAMQEELIKAQNEAFRNAMQQLLASGGLSPGVGSSPASKDGISKIVEGAGLSGFGNGTPPLKKEGIVSQGDGSASAADERKQDARDQIQQDLLAAQMEIIRRIQELMAQLLQDRIQGGQPGTPPVIERVALPMPGQIRTEAALQDQAKKQLDEQVPAWLRPYASVARKDFSTHLPDVSNLPNNTAFYGGRAVGQAGNGTALDGLFSLSFGQDGADLYVNGTFGFGSDDVNFCGLVPDASRNGFIGTVSDGTLAGGYVTGGDVRGAFFGPNAHQVGGSWNFVTSGGAMPGTATGQFAGGVIETQ